MFIDTHAHLNFMAFKEDISDVLKSSTKAQVEKIINVGSNYETSKKALEMANKNDLFASVGLHPIHLLSGVTESCVINGKEYRFTTKKEEFNYEKYKDLAKKERVVAIGEVGIDWYRLEGDVEKAKVKQEEVFNKFVELSDELNLPLIIHCRGDVNNPDEAYDRVIDILKGKKNKGVVHCFTGNLEQAKKITDLGLYIGVNGIVTFKNSTRLQNIIKEISLESIVLETDCPYLAPEPYRGKRNDPSFIPVIGQSVALIKGVTLKEVEDATTKNAINLFNIH